MWDAIIWCVIAGIVLLIQRLTSNSTWGKDMWVAMIVACSAVGFYILARNRSNSGK